MNFSIEEISKWYETEAGKINGNLVTCSVNNIIKDKLNSDILYIGPNNIVKEIMHDNPSFKSFYISSSSNCDIKAEIQKLPLKESSVDCVVLIHSLETNKNPHGGDPFVSTTPAQGQIQVSGTSVVTCAAKKNNSTCPAANAKTSDAENITTAIDTTGFSL